MLMQEFAYPPKVSLVRPGRRYWITVHATTSKLGQTKGETAASEPCLISIR